jgi:hypothetical protein
MRTIKQKTLIRGLHVYKRQVKPGDILSCKLDQFWMLENPSRYSKLLSKIRLTER